MTNLKYFIILLRLTNVLLVITFLLYLLIRFNTYIDHQIEKTLEIMLRSITDLTPYRAVDPTRLEIYVASQVIKLTTLIGEGNMLSAFAIIRDIMAYLIKSNKNIYASNTVEREFKHLIRLLQYFLPYLKYTSKFFYPNSCIHKYIPLHTPFLLKMISLFIVLSIILKIYIIHKEDIKK